MVGYPRTSRRWAALLHRSYESRRRRWAALHTLVRILKVPVGGTSSSLVRIPKTTVGGTSYAFPENLDDDWPECIEVPPSAGGPGVAHHAMVGAMHDPSRILLSAGRLARVVRSPALWRDGRG